MRSYVYVPRRRLARLARSRLSPLSFPSPFLPLYVYILRIRSTYSFPLLFPLRLRFSENFLYLFFPKNFSENFFLQVFSKIFPSPFISEIFLSLVFLLRIYIMYTYYVYVLRTSSAQLSLSGARFAVAVIEKNGEKLFTAFPYIYYIYNFCPYIFNVNFLKEF